MFIQCKSKDYLTPYEYEGRIIEFGSGGGFAGKVKQYTIMDNGQVFLNANREGVVDVLKNLKKDDAKQLFESYDRLNFADLNIDSPGNRYHFITMRGNGQEHKLTWGSKDDEATKELIVFHKILKNKIKSLTGSDTAKSK